MTNILHLSDQNNWYSITNQGTESLPDLGQVKFCLFFSIIENLSKTENNYNYLQENRPLVGIFCFYFIFFLYFIQ